VPGRDHRQNPGWLADERLLDGDIEAMIGRYQSHVRN
jgi:hypothetical protein